jgi:hypothetical protein
MIVYDVLLKIFDCAHRLIKTNEKINGINKNTMFRELALLPSSSNKIKLKLKWREGLLSWAH